jgi:hypothetical protein
MHNAEAHDLIRACHTLTGKIDDLQNELEDTQEELEGERQKLRKLLDQSGNDHLIVEGYGFNYKIVPFGQSLVRITLQD